MNPKPILIFGSTAMKHWFPNWDREPNDIDYIGKGKSTVGKEYHWCDAFNYILENNRHSTYVDPHFLYTIKVSHAPWDIWWDKTMHHIIFMKNHGCVLDSTLHDLLIKEWNVIHGKKRVKLDVKNEEFFNKNITREFDHDWLHEQMAFYEEPLHNLIRENPSSPLCSRKLWDMLSYDIQIQCALEETYVIAYERYNKYPPRHAKVKALKNLITSMTKGWFNLFLIENFETLLKYDDSHFKVVKEFLDESRISS